ncbi:phosphatase PAP2 family protein [Streptomyces sulphureus]|uniref:phosphatase PAP2 family protein n=1 Tax=Streptomyces sulphureus TaxID=47758 RepID=UPI001FE1692F|nr:phosphatase PAP2 family protein [Streptomyces sulphureus]
MAIDRRPRWWTELPLIAVVYTLYSLCRLLARGDVAAAVDHGLAILRVERLLGLDFETWLNDVFTHNAWIGIPADFAYAALHYVATPAVLVWVFRRHLDTFRELRTWLLSSTVIALAGFTLLPTSPPRLLHPGHGFVDTMAEYSAYGWWGDEASAPRGLGGLTNQYAAMPSLHVGWALWCAVVLWRLGPRVPWVRGLAVAYPLGITVIVMGTANHYFLDAVAGAAVMGAGYLLTPSLLRLSRRVRGLPPEPAPRLPLADPVPRAAATRAVSGGCKTAASTATSRKAHADDHTAAVSAHAPPGAPAAGRRGRPPAGGGEDTAAAAR